MGRKKMINYTDEDIIKALQTKSYVNVNKTMNIPMSYLNKLKIEICPSSKVAEVKSERI